MIKLTTEEKAARYDSLQTALNWSKEQYKRRLEENEKRYTEAVRLGIIGAYSKGLADGFGYILEDLERWTE